MNYIIWNGAKSDILKGLIISELPPISKPAMRTIITEIEGKDGDIVDKIGYAAYEKQLKIGLCGNFDIDKIIKYFTGSGKIILSNEPDKYYYAEILNQIDFERLIRFKTASIMFHTQPFKYLVNEKNMEIDIENQTEIIVTNQGLERSLPTMTLFGVGIITIKINNNGVFTLTINPQNDHITVNSAIQEAYKDTISELKNRQMIGEFPVLQPGENIITWSVTDLIIPPAEENQEPIIIPGKLERLEIEPKSRWI